MHIESISQVLPHVHAAGQSALEMQRSGTLRRSYKNDGSVVTKADREVEDFLIEKLASLYPQANILAEETTRVFDPARPYTFALDPVDGTDVFSQGWPGWSLSLALLDRDLVPIAGVIFAPRWDLFLVADVGLRPMLNGHPLDAADKLLPLSASSSLMVTSRIHRLLDLRRFPGKTRSVGSAALHLCFPLIYPDTVAAVQMPETYIWDIAAAHALCLAMGYRFEYLDGRELDYTSMVQRNPAEDVILAGPAPILHALRGMLVRV
jgi:fructose-1,6-bisphosphatase/inositol monophosphatase family enzyme